MARRRIRQRNVMDQPEYHGDLSPADARMAVDAASNYIKQKGYSESSLEAARRAAKSKKRIPRARIGNYEQDI